MSTHKLPKWDRNRSAFLKIGFIVALLSVIIIFQTESMSTQPEEYQVEAEDIGIIEPIRTPYREKVKTPPPKAPEPEDIIEKIIDDPEFVEQLDEPTEDDVIDNDRKEPTEDYFISPVDTTSKAVAPPAPKPEPVVEPEIELVFRAERMPCFGSCAETVEEEERRKCTEEALLSFIYSKLKYPALARENGIHGRVITSFVVDKDGNVKDIQIKRDIGGGCGKVVKEIIGQLPSWIPGKQNGRPVHVQYTIPIKFELN